MKFARFLLKSLYLHCRASRQIATGTDVSQGLTSNFHGRAFEITISASWLVAQEHAINLALPFRCHPEVGCCRGERILYRIGK